jgi:fatty acid desaturase
MSCEEYTPTCSFHYHHHHNDDDDDDDDDDMRENKFKVRTSEAEVTASAFWDN